MSLPAPADPPPPSGPAATAEPDPTAPDGNASVPADQTTRTAAATDAGSTTPRSAAARAGSTDAGAQTATPTDAAGAKAAVASGPVDGGTRYGGPAGRPGGVAVAARPAPAQAGPPQAKPWPPGAPPTPSLVARRWPGPTTPARPLLLGAVTAGAIVAASTVQPDRPGLGWSIATVAVVGALATVAARRAPTPPPTGLPASEPPTDGPPASRSVPPTADARPPAQRSAAPTGRVAGSAARPGATGAPGRAPQLAWAAATIALVGVGPVRAAGWLFVLCLLAAVATATLAVTGGRTPIGMLAAAVLPPVAALRALPWARRGLAGRRPDGAGLSTVLATLAASVALLLPFGLLFSSADAIFADLLAELLPDISPGGVVGWAFRFLLIGGWLLGGAYLLTRPPDLDLRAAPARPMHRLEWALPLALLDALFAVFVLVQLTVLFGGSGHVLRTAGLSYAQYARSGFWQLLTVSALTLLVLAGAARWAPRGTRADRLLIRVLLGALTLLSLVVVASALYRMNVYTQAYGATRLRLVVTTVELWLGLLFVLVGVAVVRLRAGWLPRLVLATAVLALLGLAVANPDRLIAERNVDRYRETGRLDVGYLAGLSADAAPVVDKLPEPLRSCALRRIALELPADGVRTWNLGRARARDLLRAEPAGAMVTSCPGPPRW